MYNFIKIVVGLSLASTSLVYAAADLQEESLDSFLRDYDPQAYSAFKESGVDINSLEDSLPSDQNAEGEAMSTARTSVIGLPYAKTPRSVCEGHGGIFLENNYVATCVSKDGTFGNGRYSLGMTFNPAGTGTVTHPDYLMPGSPFEFFSVSYGGQVFTNNNNFGPGISYSDNIPTNIKKLNRYPMLQQEGGAFVVSKISGPSRSQQLTVTQKYTLEPNSREIVIRVEAHNTGQATLKNVMFARGLDPDQDRPRTFHTLNKVGHSYFPSTVSGKVIHVAPNNIAWAVGRNSKLSVALYSVDPVKHNTCISRSWTTIPSNILYQICGTDPQPVYDYPKNLFGLDYSDSTINIAFALENLAPNEKKVFSFKYLFNKP